MTPTCDYCQQPAKLVSGTVIYPHRQDLADKRFWNCAPCDAYVGCHDGTETPLGRLANEELRKAKMAAHAAFDPLWQRSSPKQRFVRRSEAYHWLSKQLGLTFRDTHIGMFDIAMCQRVIEVCKEAA